MASRIVFRGFALGVTLSLLLAGDAAAFLNNGRWSLTATDGATAPLGHPVTLTWSVVPDGTRISHLNKNSNLISTFDALFPGSTGLPLTEKPWFELVEQSFNRWSELSGVTYLFEPFDDSANHGSFAGQLGVRGDVRIGGASIDGTGGTLAEAGFIPNSDITIDTADTAHFGAPGGIAPYLNFRTSFMHEIGHTLGLGHSMSNDSDFLMESGLPPQLLYDGPQLDDIRGAQYLYGDVNERSFVGTGNGSMATATPLGSLGLQNVILVGEHAANDTTVLATETDFLSIAHSSDDDYFSFSLAESALVNVVLTPLGPTYHERGQLVSSARSDLSLELYTMVGEMPVFVSSANVNPIGVSESLPQQPLHAGREYFARIHGASESPQLYQLSIDATATLLVGDFNADGIVDAADYVVWRDSVGSESDSPILHRGDGTPGVGQGDYAVWKLHFGETSGLGSTEPSVVPEPPAIIACFAAILALVIAPRRQVLRNVFSFWSRRMSQTRSFC